MTRSRMGSTLVGAALTVLLGTFAAAPAMAEPVAPAAPVITWQGAIPAGATYSFGDVPAAPTCTATVEAVPVPCAVTGYATTVGTHLLTATAATEALPNTATISYTVQAWTLKGFYKPVKMDVVNKVKAGSTVPFKFKVYEGQDKLKSTATVATFTAQQVSCTDPAATIGAATPLADSAKTKSGKIPAGFKLKYKAGAFHQNWKTPKLAKVAKVAKAPKPAAPQACYVVTLTTDDGSALRASFLLK